MKKFVTNLGALVSIISLIGSIAVSEQYQSKTLFKKGAWFVEITHDSQDGNLWCTATTTNRYSQSLVITAYDTNELVLFVFDDAWKLKPRPVTFLVDVDYSRWTMNGEAGGSNVSVRMADVDKTIKFLKEIKRGSAVAVYNESDHRLATFSLSGSSAAISELMECWVAISKQADPFGNNSDPFGASSDPF